MVDSGDGLDLSGWCTQLHRQWSVLGVPQDRRILGGTGGLKLD